MKEPKQRFILNLKLNTEKYQECILAKRFEISRQIYNAILGKALKRYNEMVKTKQWRENQNIIAEIYKKNDKNKAKKLAKPYFDIKKDMLLKYRLNEYSLHDDIAEMQHHFKDNIDAFTAQKIASRVWKAIENSLFSRGKEVHFKSYNKGLDSIEGKSNDTGIRYNIKDNVCLWNGLKISVQLNINNDYEVDSLRNKICYCRIKRKFVRGRYKYILQLVLNGVPPIKINKQTGEIKNNIGIGKCGIDIGTQTIAYVSDYDCKLYELAPNVQNIENKKYKIQRYMDRSKRTTNLNNFNKDGTIKKGKLKWDFSNKYIKAKNKLKDLYRKQSDIRRQDHNIMANEILVNCNIIYVENMNYKGLQERAKKTEKNEKGKFKKKKRFGKSLANKAPSMFLTILSNKLKTKGGLYLEINTYKVKASQYNHTNRKYNKKKLSQRWNDLDGIKVQRDLYSAYLIKNVNDDLETINNDKCVEDFDNFIKLHNREIIRLQGKQNLSSMGI